MTATGATSAFLRIASSASESTPGKIGGNLPTSVDARGNSAKSKPASPGMKVKANAQAPTKVNGSKVGLMDGLKFESDVTHSPAPRTFINQLPDWSMLLAAITTMFLAAEKQWMLDWKPKRPDMLDPWKIVQDGLIFRQNFSIRSYEIGADRTANIETLMNHLQVMMAFLFVLLNYCLLSEE